MNVKILVCCHKQDVMAMNDPYLPIQVGKNLSSIDLGIKCDNEGDNISSKNKSYCECTGMYWAWKNLKNVDIIGLCHYRRYFDFHKQCKWPYPLTSFHSNQFSTLNLSIPSRIINLVFSGKLVVAKPRVYPIPLWYAYCNCHYSDDFRIIEQIIEEQGDQKYIDAFKDRMWYNNQLICFNMFLMKWDDFDNYCKWLFQILAEAEKRIDISHYNSTQSRIWGYVAERLFNVWLYANKKSLIKTPVIWVNDKEQNNNKLRYIGVALRYIGVTLRNNLAVKIMTARLKHKVK